MVHLNLLQSFIKGMQKHSPDGKVNAEAILEQIEQMKDDLIITVQLDKEDIAEWQEKYDLSNEGNALHNDIKTACEVESRVQRYFDTYKFVSNEVY